MEEKEINNPRQPKQTMTIKEIFKIGLLSIGILNGILGVIGSVVDAIVYILGKDKPSMVANNKENFLMFLALLSIFFILEELERINNNTNKTNQP